MRIGLPLALLILTGCATATPEKMTIHAQGLTSTRITVGLKETAKLKNGYFVLLNNQAGHWMPLVLSQQSSDIKWAKEGQEILFVSKDFSYVQPAYEKLPARNTTSNLFDCSYLHGDDHSYSPCTSKLTEADSTIAIGKALLALPSLGTSLGSARRLDKEKVIEVVEETNLFTFIKEETTRLAKIQALKAKENAKYWKLKNYRQAFNEAKTSSDYTNFINRYQNYDPDFLINQAIQLRDVALTKELEAEARRQVEIAEKERKRQQRLLAEQKRQEQAKAAENARQERIKAMAEIYRKSFKVGVETNCGPIVALNGDMVKVYAPVRGYGNEHWIHREKLYHPVVGCRFTNGRYIAPL